MMNIPFEKYQGLGNDFVLFDRNLHPELPVLDQNMIKRICNRRFGVGADGILMFDMTGEKQIRMIYHNSDGSRAETCFNGIRCIALHAVLTGVERRDSVFAISTDSGPVQVRVPAHDNLVEMTLSQGAELDPDKVPVSLDHPLIDNEIDFGTFKLTGTALSIGNPHFVAWIDTDNLDLLNAQVEEKGKSVENFRIFPEGVNFELACRIRDNLVRMAVWERGTGRTSACGSGATATVYAGVISGRLPAGKPIEVEMTGGKLLITVPHAFSRDNLSGSIKITGEVQHIFTGSLDSDFS